MTELSTMPAHRFATRDNLAASIAAQLAETHRQSWITMDMASRAEYLADAHALLDQGLTPLGLPEDFHHLQNPSPELEAEAFEFGRAMEWFNTYLQARHPDWQRTGILPGAHMEQADPLDWDAWLTISVPATPTARALWSQRYELNTGEPRPTDTPPLPEISFSAPPPARDIRGARTQAAIGAVLAHRHGRRWMDLPADIRSAYLNDARALMTVGLTVT
ncbi:hypothetical protein BKG86_00085 [Mycobacteroides chelonae]|uniref:hypothetical protein n=1 Tax=Mycobacteroides chelonae TaxID=1774 RepID=UPI0008AA03C8|nr:hypothetical protein [Mycobacteroides chelonae]OHU72505.1 hypothetical protein BKG86_00085 [Mycobacteroides chelonae]